MAAEPFLVGLLFFIAVAAGWLLGRRSRKVRAERGSPAPADYYRGLDHLLRDESDKAVAVLQSLAEADPGVIEIHFALATLFRKRGETDRAIRVHQGLLARPRLSQRHRAQALFDLAEDYLKAGLYDRAEALLKQLVDQGQRVDQALTKLISVYERQRDWDQAIEARLELATLVPGDHDAIIAQYYCEEAALAASKSDLHTMRSLLKNARKADKESVRGAFMRAELALELDDVGLAARLCERLLVTDPVLVSEVLPLLRRCYSDDPEKIEAVLATAMRRSPELADHLGRAQIATQDWQSGLAEIAARDVVKSNASLQHWLDDGRSVASIAELLRSLGLGTREFLCQQCGYLGSELHWQCPACNTWDATRPRVQLHASS